MNLRGEDEMWARQRTWGVAAAVGAIALGGAAAHADEILLGAEVALTGPMASFVGPNMRTAFEIATERVNRLKLAGPHTIKTMVEDTAGDKAQVIAITTKFATRDKVAAILGPPTTVLGAAAAPVADNLATPIVIIAYSAELVANRPWAYKAYMESNASSKAIAEFTASHLKAKSIVEVYDRGNDASTEIKDGVSERLTKAGVKVLAEEGTQQGDTNFGPLATKIVSLNPDVLFLATPPELAANVVIQARQAGLSPDTKIIGIGNLASPAYARTGGKAVEGTYYTSDYFAGMPSAENKEFVAAYQEKMKMDPDAFAGGAYAATMIVANAIRQAGDHPDREKIRDAIGQTKDFDTILGTGKMTIDDKHVTSYDLIMLQLVDGKNEIAK
jgi:branched-chain amino acid transport system substrate-binding protein